MFPLRLSFVSIVLTIMSETLPVGSVYSQSKDFAIAVRLDNDHPNQLNHILKIYPTEIYYGDPVYFSTYVENISPKAVYVNRCHPMNYEEFAGRLKISNSLSEREYTWILENPTGLHMDFSTERTVIPPGEKIYTGSAVIEFPPLEDWNDPFWKEIRENLSPEGVVCQFQIADKKRRELLTQDILIKPRPEEEMILLDKWFDDTPKNLFPRVSLSTKMSNVYSLGRDDGGFIVVGGKEYNPVRFVRSSAFRKPFIPNNPTTLEGWRELESKFCDSTLRDEIKYTRLLLEYLEAEEGEKAEQTKKELTNWIDSLPVCQRSFFYWALVEKCRWFYNETPFAEKSRGLMDYYNVKYETPGVPKTSYPRHKYTDSMSPTEEEIANGSRTLQDGCRIWIYNGPIFTETLAAKIIQFKGPNRVTIQYRDLRMEDLNIDQFSKEDQKYIQEMKSKNPSGSLPNSIRKR